MPYPDDFNSAAFEARMGREPSARAETNTAIAQHADKILGNLVQQLMAISTPPGAKTAEMIDEAIAWIDEHRGAILSTAEREAQDL